MASRDAEVAFGVLGPLQVSTDGRGLELGSPQVRLVLTALLVDANAVVSADRLIEVLWGDQPPPSAASSVQKLVYRLRSLLGAGSDDVVGTRVPGYVLHVAPERFDAACFERLVIEAQAMRRQGNPSEAVRLLDEAMRLWRGPAFGEFAFAEFAHAEAARLEELRWTAVEERVEGHLTLGAHEVLVGELEVLVRESPYRERLWGELMLALYRSGRQAEALRAYARVRELLGEELGIEPGVALRGLEEAMLLQKPELDWVPPASTMPRAPADTEGARLPVPSGTVTFLFTDLEGSTRLWEEEEHAMTAALVRHDEILRSAVEKHAGFVVKTTGDGVHAAFATASDALQAAVDAQRRLVAEQWSVSDELRVRMGVHTGSAEHRDGDYFGPAANRAARLMAAAHGGQVVVSLATEELVRDSFPDDVTLVDLGEHRLRDLARPERIFQLVHPELRSDFARLQSLDAFPCNLPAQVSSFVGRDHDITEVAHALAEWRLLTLTGVGGVGKTRLAIQVAAEVLPHFPDGAWLCELAAASEPETMLQVIATALGVQARPGVSIEDRINEFLRTKRLLVVLDNCEHLLDAAARFAAAVLRDAPQVSILATSREGLAVDGEHIRALRSLSVPDPSADVETLARSDAARLFVDRAQAVDSSFVLDAATGAAVGELCRRLDGVPLAIELAAARIVAMSPAEIATRLDERFRLLTGGRRAAVERHQTLRATVDWSFSLCSPVDQRVFARLGVFAGTFGSSAAEAVATGEGVERWDVIEALASLVAKSMVVGDRAADRSTRYSMLETLRAYARERLDETDDPDQWRRRHAEHFAGFAEQAGSGLKGPDEHVWRARVRAELDNVRAAIGWALESSLTTDAQLGLRIVAALAYAGGQRHDRRGRRLDRACRRAGRRDHARTAHGDPGHRGDPGDLRRRLRTGADARTRRVARRSPARLPGPRPRLLRPGELRVEPQSAGRGAARHPTRAPRRGGRRIRHVHAQHLPFQSRGVLDVLRRHHDRSRGGRRGAAARAAGRQSFRFGGGAVGGREGARPRRSPRVARCLRGLRRVRPKRREELQSRVVPRRRELAQGARG